MVDRQSHPFLCLFERASFSRQPCAWNGSVTVCVKGAQMLGAPVDGEGGCRWTSWVTTDSRRSYTP